MLNDPFRGGTHLPDIALQLHRYLCVLRDAERRISRTLCRSRAHHADVGGTYPGSMGLCREIYQEGLRIPPVKLMQGGEMNRDVLALLLNNVRTPEEREGDLSAQLAACHTGADRLREVCARYGVEHAQRMASDLLDYSEHLMGAFLESVPEGEYRAEDFLDGDGITESPAKVAVAIRFHRPRKKHHRDNIAGDGRLGYRVTVDFAGSDPQVEGSINAVFAITYSVCFYVFRCLLAEDVPATAGLMRPIRVIAPEGSIVNARPPAAVAGGNVETSQRIVDVLLRALSQAIPERVPAAASGTMNNPRSAESIPGLARRSPITKRSPEAWGRGRESQEFRRPHPHDEFAEHAGGGVGARLSTTRALLLGARRQRRSRTLSRRTWNCAGD